MAPGRTTSQVRQAVFWDALIGWGLGETREEIEALPVAYRDGRKTSWRTIVENADRAQAYKDVRWGAPIDGIAIGYFLVECFKSGFLDGAESLYAQWREEDRHRIKSAIKARAALEQRRTLRHIRRDQT